MTAIWTIADHEGRYSYQFGTARCAAQQSVEGSTMVLIKVPKVHKVH